MRTLLLVTALLSLAGLAGCLSDDGPADGGDGLPAMYAAEVGDAVVLAIVDSSFNPYHHDFLADAMPQHLDDDPDNDLPLDRPPHEWLPGFADPSEFSSYEALELNLSLDPDAVPAELHGSDAESWSSVNTSDTDDIHFRYIPGTKIIGYVNFAGGDGFSPASHGGGTTSVSVGNIHGTCPECLLVFVNSYHAFANPWMAQQDWIDVQSNSWGASTVFRDNIYTDCDLETLQAGVERGQQIVWSGGNGQANAFVAPVNTLNSCQKGPDFLITVGAIDPDNQGSYTGHGKPVDISSYGMGYPRAGGGTVTAESTFSGTSNAAPVIAGFYAKALYEVRKELDGASRTQADGVIAYGETRCGDANPDCPMADELLTVHELRHALFRAATFTDAYFSTTSVVPAAEIPVGTEETEFFTEGHGSLHGRLGDHEAEATRIVDEVFGRTYDEPSQELLDWMTAYSYCSQQVWGEWQHGYWVPGSGLPDPDPQWPVRTWLGTECPTTMEAVIAAGDTA